MKVRECPKLGTERSSVLEALVINVTSVLTGHGRVMRGAELKRVLFVTDTVNCQLYKPGDEYAQEKFTA